MDQSGQVTQNILSMRDWTLESRTLCDSSRATESLFRVHNHTNRLYWDAELNPTSSNLHCAYRVIPEGLSIFSSEAPPWMVSDGHHVCLFINRGRVTPSSLVRLCCPPKSVTTHPTGGKPLGLLKNRLAAKIKVKSGNDRPIMAIISLSRGHSHENLLWNENGYNSPHRREAAGLVEE